MNNILIIKNYHVFYYLLNLLIQYIKFYIYNIILILFIIFLFIYLYIFLFKVK